MTPVSYFSSSLSHSSLVTSLFCLPPRICPTCFLPLSNLLSFLEIILEEERASSVQFNLLPWAPDSHIQLDSFSSSKPAHHTCSGRRPHHPPCHPEQKPWDLSQISCLSPSVLFKIVPPTSSLLTAVDCRSFYQCTWIAFPTSKIIIFILHGYQNFHSKMQIWHMTPA